MSRRPSPVDPGLRRHLAPARAALGGVVAAGVAGSLLVLAQAWVVTGLVVAAVGGRPLTGWALLVLAVLALRGLTGWAGDVAAARAAARVGTALRRRLLPVVLHRTDAASSGEHAVLLTRGVSAAEPYLTRYLPALVLAAVLPALTVIAIGALDLLSAVIVVATLPLVPVFGALVGLATRDRAERQWRALASLSGHFVDVVRGLPTLVAHRRARAQSATVARVTERYRRASLGTLRLAFASSAVLELVATLSVALVAVTVGVRLAHGDLDLHTALLVLLLAPEAYWPLRRVGAEFHAAAEGVATFERVDALLAADTAVPAPDHTAARAEGRAPRDRAPLQVRGLTVLRPGRTVPALADLDLDVPARGVTVVTGPSGCGKSTLLAVLAGLVAPTSGTVTVGGTPVAGASWQAGVAWLPQRPVFVRGSIADNLRLAAPAARDEELWSALRRVALEERVRTLPGGLAAELGEDGRTLSAGERARLALARVVVAARPWVLLDEPTAHLDDLTEQVIADTVAELGRTSGVVVVAHRPALVELAQHTVALPAPAAAPPAPPAPPASRPPRVPARREPGDTPAAPEPAPARGLGWSIVLGTLASLSGVALTATSGWLIVQASSQPPVLTLLLAVVGVRAFGLARPVLRYAERLRSHDVALRLLARRRVEVYDTLVPLVPGRLGARRGDLLASVVDDVDGVVDQELRVRLPLWSGLLVSAVAVLGVALVVPAAAAVLALSGPVAGLLAYWLARRGAGAAERRTVDGRAALSEAVVESLQVAPELVMWQADAAATDRVAGLSSRLGAATARAGTWLGAARALVLVAAGAGIAGTALVAAPAAAAGAVTDPVLALLVLVPLALAEVVLPLADAGALRARTRAAEQRLHRLERTAPAVRDTVALRPAPSGSELRLDGVRARWPGARSGLDDASFEVPPGGRLGVVGPSGSGKSTLAAVLLRFLDPVSGTVTLGGEPTDLLALDDVRRRVGLVDDDPHVFASTLVENVRLARPEATDAEVEVALRQACLGPWLDALPDGLDTWLGDGHAQVSGGERARLGVARSLLADQPVVVLDEPTAHLDHATATDLAREVLVGSRRRSVVWITHDPVGLDLVDACVTLGAADLRGGSRLPSGGAPR